MSRTSQRIFRSAAALVMLAVTDSAVAQRDLKDIPPPDPELERATFVLPEGFEVNLFAADPKIAKPIQMNFDEAGRLWIVSSEVYPHIEPGAEASDRVIVLEDADRDGVSDATHVFAEGLLIPTGIAPGDGGAYVANSTELLHFADNDNDLKADAKRIVLSGFGTEDTHHILHTLRWGPDGYLYFNQSIYIHSHIETPWGVRRLSAGGIWQFRPETLELGVFLRGLVNPWGHHFDRFGQSFATDGAGGEGINYVIPGAYYFTAADAPELLAGLNPGSPKHCGLEIVETPMLPAEWQGSAITNDFRGHRVCRFTLTGDRAGYVSREQQEVIRSDHVAFRPIDVKLGPDGAIYIADWYNPIIQHGEVDFRDSRRDHTHGRIWRVSWKGAPRREHVDLPTLSNVELFEQLQSDDNFRRQAAKQLLRQRGDEVVAELDDWLRAAVGSVRRDSDPVETAATGSESRRTEASEAAEHLKLEALWVYQAAREIRPELLTELLTAETPEVRAAAVRVLSHWKYQIADSQRLLERLASDPHSRVRLEAVRALSFSPNDDAEFAKVVTASNDEASRNELWSQRNDPSRIATAMAVTDLPTDTFLDYAIRLTARELADDWLPAFRDGNLEFSSADHLLTAFAAVGRDAPVELLLSRLDVASLTTEQRAQLTTLVLEGGTPEQLAAYLVASPVDAAPSILQRMLDRTRRDNVQVPLDKLDGRYATLIINSPHVQLRTVALRAAGQWRLAGYADLLPRIARDSNATPQEHRAALEGMALSGDDAMLDQLQQYAGDPSLALPVRKHAVIQLADTRPGQAAGIVAKLLPEMTDDDKPGEIAAAFLSLKNGGSVLAEQLADVSFSSDVARDLLKSIRESGLAATELENAVRKAGKITSRKELSAEERDRLLKIAAKESNPADGEAVFRSPQFNCLKCHAIGGAGGKVGPDMISLGGSAQPDYLLESLLNPNAKIKENYNTIVVVTTDGKLHSGIQVQQSETSVVLRNAEDQLVEINRADIEEMVPGLSLMPEGLVDSLTDDELAALVRFLSELGRTPDYSLSRRELARSWTIMASTEEAAFRLRRTSRAQAATDDPAFEWTARFSTIAGHLPLGDIPVVSESNRSATGTAGVGFARCVVNVETAGVVLLQLDDITGLDLRVDEQPVALNETLELFVTPGAHRLTFVVDTAARTQPLQLEILPTAGSAVAVFEK